MLRVYFLFIKLKYQDYFASIYSILKNILKIFYPILRLNMDLLLLKRIKVIYISY